MNKEMFEAMTVKELRNYVKENNIEFYHSDKKAYDMRRSELIEGILDFLNEKEIGKYEVEQMIKEDDLLNSEELIDTVETSTEELEKNEDVDNTSDFNEEPTSLSSDMLFSEAVDAENVIPVIKYQRGKKKYVCPCCGYVMGDEDNFCLNCGTLLNHNNGNYYRILKNILPNNSNNPSKKMTVNKVRGRNQLFCPTCNERLWVKDHKYCHKCGQKVEINND